MWQGRRVVLGVTGGIAAYKCVLLARELTQRGAQVDVVMSRGATEFIGAVTFEAVSRRPVRSSLWERNGALDHIALGQQADVIIVAPATAHFIARAAAGIADDLLMSIVLASTAPILIAPAMNDAMYANPATRSNLDRLVSRGWRTVGPVVGDLAEGPSDRPGRMADLAAIIAHAARAMHVTTWLTGQRVVITAGPTREAIDPVRILTNRSSGKMGYRLAEAAWQRGAMVTLVSGPSSEPDPVGVDLVRVETTAEMAAAVRSSLAGSAVLIMAAAPADFRPRVPHTGKVPRQAGGHVLELDATEDILLGTAADRPPGLISVGFALETGSAVELGRAKLARKQLDLIVVNDALEPGAGFDVDTNAVTILDRRGRADRIPLQSKAAIAEAILDAIEQYHG